VICHDRTGLDAGGHPCGSGGTRCPLCFGASRSVRGPARSTSRSSGPATVHTFLAVGAPHSSRSVGHRWRARPGSGCLARVGAGVRAPSRPWHQSSSPRPGSPAGSAPAASGEPKCMIVGPISPSPMWPSRPGPPAQGGTPRSRITCWFSGRPRPPNSVGPTDARPPVGPEAVAPQAQALVEEGVLRHPGPPPALDRGGSPRAGGRRGRARTSLRGRRPPLGCEAKGPWRRRAYTLTDPSGNYPTGFAGARGSSRSSARSSRLSHTGAPEAGQGPLVLLHGVVAQPWRGRWGSHRRAASSASGRWLAVGPAGCRLRRAEANGAPIAANPQLASPAKEVAAIGGPRVGAGRHRPPSAPTSTDPATRTASGPCDRPSPTVRLGCRRLVLDHDG